MAEVAFAVADAFQGRGLGTLLLAHLAEHAHAAGVELLDAEVMADNRRMIDMFRGSGFPVLLRSERGARFVQFPVVALARRDRGLRGAPAHGRGGRGAQRAGARRRSR